MPTADEIAAHLGGPAEDLDTLVAAVARVAATLGRPYFVHWNPGRRRGWVARPGWHVSPIGPGRHMSYLEVFPGGRIVLRPARPSQPRGG